MIVRIIDWGGWDVVIGLWCRKSDASRGCQALACWYGRIVHVVGVRTFVGSGACELDGGLRGCGFPQIGLMEP